MSTAQPVRTQITTHHDAEALLSRIGDSMVALVKIFEEETSLVKAGRLSEASSLTGEKAALASQYLREIEISQGERAFSRPRRAFADRGVAQGTRRFPRHPLAQPSGRRDGAIRGRRHHAGSREPGGRAGGSEGLWRRGTDELKNPDAPGDAQPLQLSS